MQFTTSYGMVDKSDTDMPRTDKTWTKKAWSVFLVGTLSIKLSKVSNFFNLSHAVQELLLKIHYLTTVGHSETQTEKAIELSRYDISEVSWFFSCDSGFGNWQPGPASVAQLDAPSDWRPGGCGFNPRRGRQHSFVEIDHEIFSTVILSLPLI